MPRDCSAMMARDLVRSVSLQLHLPLAVGSLITVPRIFKGGQCFPGVLCVAGITAAQLTMATWRTPTVIKWGQLTTYILSLASWLMYMGLWPPSDLPGLWTEKGELEHALMNVMFTFCCHGYARDLFDRWPARFLLAELYTFAKWTTLWLAWQAQRQPWSWQRSLISCCMAQLSGVLIPLLLFRDCPKPAQHARPVARPHNTASLTVTRVAPSASKASSSAEADISRDCQPVETKVAAPQTAPIPSAPPGSASTYQSVLGPRHTMSIKISTRHHPEDLRPGALDRLARLVEQWQPGHQEQDTDAEVDNNRTRPAPQVVLHTSVRRGCILVSLDTCQPAASSSSSQFTAAQALAYAQQVLPQLLRELGLDRASGDSGEGCVSGVGMTAPTPLLEPGQYLQLQLGGHVVQASMDPNSQAWLLEVESAEDGSTSTQLCLAQPHPAAATTGTYSTSSGMHTVRFSVHVKQRQPNDYLFVRGSDPAADPSNDSDKPGLQLWVHCQGQYLRTAVEEVNSYTGRVEAVAHMPTSALARHHQPDGPIARLQLLTAELWQGPTTVLSSTPLLLDTARHMQPTLQASFGWWAASSTAVAGLVSEVSALTARVVDSPADAAVQSHQAFVSDLATWLSTVQHSASGTCCDMCEPASPGRVTLTPNQCTAVANSLRQHARHSKLRHTSLVLSAQQQSMQPQCTVFSHVLRLVQSPSLCSVCDTIYHSRLDSHLTSVYIIINILLGISIIRRVPNLINTSQPIVRVLLILAALVRVSTVLNHIVLGRYRVLPQHAWLLHSAVLPVAVWVLHLIVEMLAVGTNTPAPRSSAPFIVTHHLLTLVGHQAQAQGRAPRWVSQGLLVVEIGTHGMATRARDTQLRGWGKVWHVVGVVVVPWVMHMYWRRMLRGKHVAARTVASKEAHLHAQ